MTNLVEKPNWDDAPTWAKYLAQDKSGQWFWYEKKPVVSAGYWNNPTGMTMEINDTSIENWKETLEKRPSPITSIWDLLPQNVKYIAMDESGDWYGYKEKPFIDEDGMWLIPNVDGFYAELLQDLISFDGSLIQRPD